MHSSLVPVAAVLGGIALIAGAACAGTAPRATSSAAAGERPTSPPALRDLTVMNGCDPAAAQADTGSEIKIEFGGVNGDRFRPRCVTLEVGGAVRFAGDFARHPMTGGAVLDGEPVRDPFSPLPFTNAGSEATFRADRPGVYPFYCQVHWVLGMNGVIYVR